MGFKLGREKRQNRNSKDTPIFRKNLESGIMGEANMDGSIHIDKSVPKGSALEYNGKWYPEGDNVFPWEKRAVKEESNV